MVKFFGISLLFAFGPVFVPSILANDVISGGFGGIDRGRTADEGAVGGLLKGATSAIDAGLCRTLGPNFLPLLYSNNRCPQSYFKPDTFRSIEKICECYRSNPQLQRCLSLSVISIGLNIPGVSDAAVHFGKCCKTNEPSHEYGIFGRIGDGLTVLDIPRNPSALINAFGYGVADGTNNLLCSLVGPNFLEVLLVEKNCPSVVLLPNTFKSLESFCYRFRNEWSPDVQKCMTTSAIRLLNKRKGVINYEQDLGDCCARCPDIKPDNSPPKCKQSPPSVPPVTTPTYGC